MLVHSTPPLPPRLPPIHPRTFSSSSSTTINRHITPNGPNGPSAQHIQSPLAPPPFFRRTSSLRDPPPGGSRSPSVVESEQDIQDEDEFMAHQTRSTRRKVSRRKDDKTWVRFFDLNSAASERFPVIVSSSTLSEQTKSTVRFGLSSLLGNV
ncbi:hypothetical protein I302_100531 [Kwoniella bestiolae CBS 10118]|uniref:Uncharacterized protein n=1 Tax=Kwoniella bestiolae CBS 10118 TaxID=1296100 RepID=A0A1B9G5D0_9TREE|nr:hypothetical protein I302_03905 [Kwoniella bestiolae CBS 10118]OCF26226.1 hypothetical protein I302_03905 [Kwoniella bestiolae CBS 10118]